MLRPRARERAAHVPGWRLRRLLLATLRTCAQRGGSAPAATLLAAPPRLAGGAARTADFDGRLQLQQVWLAHEDLLCREADEADLIFAELHLLAWPPVADLQQPLYDVVYLRYVLWDRGRAERARAVGRLVAYLTLAGRLLRARGGSVAAMAGGGSRQGRRPGTRANARNDVPAPAGARAA